MVGEYELVVKLICDFDEVPSPPGDDGIPHETRHLAAKPVEIFFGWNSLGRTNASGGFGDDGCLLWRNHAVIVGCGRRLGNAE